MRIQKVLTKLRISLVNLTN